MAFTIVRKTIELDATDKPLGRLASEIARLLMGKHKPTYMPNLDSGDNVRVKHADKMKLTGDKINQKEYYHYSQYPGGLKTRKVADQMAKSPGWVLRMAVDRMLPKNTFRARRLKRLSVVK